MGDGTRQAYDSTIGKLRQPTGICLHTLKVFRTKADMPTRFPGRGIVKSANQVICRQNTYAAHNAATRAASAAQAFSRPMRCSSLTIVSMLFGTSIRDPQSQKPAAASEATTPTEVTILSTTLIFSPSANHAPGGR